MSFRRRILSVDDMNYSCIPFVSIQSLKAMVTPDVVETCLQARGIGSTPDCVRDIVARAPKLFAILVLIGQENHILHLLQNNFDDGIFPATEENAPEFETPQIRNEFYQTQWRFPPVFVRERHLELPGNAPLPFVKREFGGNGSFGVVWKVKVSRGHLVALDTDYAALKVVRRRRDELWDTIMREVETLREREHDNIVPLLAAFTIDAFGSEERSLNILFPWADMNMEQWLMLDSSPLDKSLGREGQRQWLYHEICALVAAVSYLHRDIDGQVTSHHDLKPENILWLGGSLKICDLGRSHLLSLAEGSETEGQSGLGTYTYQPPEYYNDDGTRSSRRHGRAFDVWSLGCIIVEVAILIGYGWGRQSVKEFTKARSIGPSRRRDLSKTRKIDDSFHNHMDTVRQWISDLKGNDKSRMLVQTLDVAEKMLTDDPNERIYSWEAHLDLYEMLHPDDSGMEHVASCVQPPKQGKILRVQNPLHRAAEKGNIERVVKLVASGWPLELQDASGLTAAQLAFYGGHTPVLELLANKGANMDFKAPSRSSALRWAEATNRTDLIRILKRHVLKFEETFCEAREYASATAVSPVAKDKHGKTAVHWAAQKGQMTVLRDVLGNADNPSALIQDKDGDGMTPLHWAATAGCLVSVIHLLDFESGKRTILERDTAGKTPLHHSSDIGAQEIVYWLLRSRDQCEFLVLVKDGYGMIPLHWAAQRGHANVIEMLLKPEGDWTERSAWWDVVRDMLDVWDVNGNTALQLALSHSHAEATRVLEEASDIMHLR